MHRIRYRVRAEVARKQAEGEAKAQREAAVSGARHRISGSDAEGERARASAAEDQLRLLREVGWAKREEKERERGGGDSTSQCGWETREGGCEG